MVRVVQTFMLLQVGVFYLLLRLRTPRLSRAERDAWRSPPSTPPRTISVIVPAYNEARVVGACLAALARNATDLGAVEVIVVDAGCTDGTMAAVAAVGDPLAARLRTTAAPAGGRDDARSTRCRAPRDGRDHFGAARRHAAAGGLGLFCAPRARRPGESARRLPLRVQPRAARAARRAARRPRVHGVDRPPPLHLVRAAVWRPGAGDDGARTRARRRLPGAPDPRGVRAGEPAAPRMPPPAPAASSRWPPRRRCARRGGGSARRARCGAPTPSTRR